MKKIICIAIFYNIFCDCILGQTTEKFIRIVGNSKMEFTASKTTISFNISEIQPDEYRQIRYKPVETVYQEFITALKNIGIESSAIQKESIKDVNSYSRKKFERYKISLTDDTKIVKIAELGVEGATVNEVKYLYENPGEENEEKLAALAIKDAEKKAIRLAKEIGRKLGKPLNIEDRSSGCCRVITETSNKKTELSYRLNVTFELID